MTKTNMRLVNNRVKNVDRVEVTPTTATNKSTTTKKVCNLVLAGKMQKEDMGKFTFHDTCPRSFYWNSETQNMSIQINRKML